MTPRLPSLLFLLLLPATDVPARMLADVLAEARAAEAQLEADRALALFLEADRLQPGDAAILQKVAQQYSDLVVDQRTAEDRREYARTALAYAERAAALAPGNAVNVLSIAVCHGRLAVAGGAREKVAHSRLVRQYAERALALDPDYAWAHHVLGRWHYEVASLGAAERIFVRVFYGGLPGASFDQALAHLRRAVELEPDEPAHRLELGFACAAAGRPAEARDHWEQGLRLPARGKHGEPARQRARAALESLR